MSADVWLIALQPPLEPQQFGLQFGVNKPQDSLYENFCLTYVSQNILNQIASDGIWPLIQTPLQSFVSKIKFELLERARKLKKQPRPNVW